MAKNKQNSSKTPRSGSLMSKYVSFFMLVVVIVVCGFYFYNVIKGFLLPLFLATLLAVIFRPLHEKIALRCGRRVTLAAVLSTSLIMSIVILPLAGLLSLGLYEANQLVTSRGEYLRQINEKRRELGLQKPFAEPLDAIETELRRVDQLFNDALHEDRTYFNRLLGDATTKIITELDHLRWQIHFAAEDLGSKPKGDFDDELLKAKAGKLWRALPEGDEKLRKEAYHAEQRSLKFVLTKSESDTPEVEFVQSLDDWENQLTNLQQLILGNEDGKTSGDSVSTASLTPPSLLELRQNFADIQFEYDQLRTALLGGPIWNRVTEWLNPSDALVNEWVAKVLFTGGATRWLPSITNTATSLIMGLLMGLAIMSVALFYFFLDGPKMLHAFMHLSPLDDRHEAELLQEFDKVSRAVVLATLLSAVAQGILGGIGYKLVGLHSVFLLTLLTTVLALIPFVGAAAVWVPCCLYIAFVKETTDPGDPRTWMYARAGFLAVYGFVIISMADNVIKPWVLQGQSKLHPLLALLSVLGGVQALGPIGILVGPMVVAFLQVLLTILQREIVLLDDAIKRVEQ